MQNAHDDAQARTVTDALDALKRDTWVKTLFILIHTPHQTGERHLERFKGAGAVGDWADALWTYVADSQGVRYLSAVGRARIWVPESALAWDPATGLLWWAGGSRAQTGRDRQREAIIRALEAAGPEGLLTDPLKDAAGGHRPDAPGVIAQLAADGVIEVEPRGRAKVHRLRRAG